MANGISNTMNQMAGYGMPPAQPAMNPNQFQQVPSMMPGQFSAPASIPMNNPYAQQSVTPPWQSQSTTPVAPPATNYAPPAQPTAPVAPDTAGSSASACNMPKCFGQYDPGNVNCVVCPHEVECSRNK